MQDLVIQMDLFEEKWVHTARDCFELPAVFVPKNYRKRIQASCTRSIVFLRDELRDQDCRKRLPEHEARFNHDIPRHRYGLSNWGNSCVAQDILFEFYQWVGGKMHRMMVYSKVAIRFVWRRLNVKNEQGLVAGFSECVV